MDRAENYKSERVNGMNIDLNNRNNQLIIAAMAGMVEDEGMTPREVLERLEQIKSQTYFGLMDIYNEVKAKQK